MSLFRLTITLAPIATGGAAIALVALQKELSPRAKAVLQFIVWIGAFATALGLVTVGPEAVDSFFDMQPRIKRVLEEFSTLSVQMQRAIIAGSLAALVFGTAYLVWTRPAWRPVVFAVFAAISIAAATYYITDTLNARKAQEYVEKGEKHLQAQNYEAAVAAYTKAIELHPAVLHKRRSFLVSLGKENDGANTTFTKPFMLESSMPAYFWRGVAFYWMQRFDQAVADLTKAAELTEDVTIYRARSITYSKLGLWEKAIGDADRVVEMEPSAFSYAQRGDLFLEAGSREKAIENFKKAFHINGDGDKLLEEWIRGQLKKLGAEEK